MSGITLADSPRPLRADAERNRLRILDAAREVFRERGLGATLNDIAHHAGVGVGTVYRRFPNKDQLIEDLFEQRIGELAALLDEACADPDPWHGFTDFLYRSAELQAPDRGLTELITFTPEGLDRIARARDGLLPKVGELVRRAQASGQMRADGSPQDPPVMQLMLSAVIDASRDVAPDLWRRYLGIMIRGLAADPDRERPLSAATLAPEQIDVVMTNMRPTRR